MDYSSIKEVNIKLQDIKKEYNDKEVLKGININISNESFFSILGKSGAGKSTLLNIMGLIENCSQGEYSFNDTAIKNTKDYSYLRKEYIGIIFQSYNLIKKLTCEENIKLPLLYSKKTIEKNYYKELIERLNLQEILKKPVSVLSGGEKQRVAVARSLVNNPSLIIADEPTGNLDSENKWKVFEILKEEHEKGRGVVIVTHDEELASKTEKKYFLNKGLLYEID